MRTGTPQASIRTFEHTLSQQRSRGMSWKTLSSWAGRRNRRLITSSQRDYFPRRLDKGRERDRATDSSLRIRGDISCCQQCRIILASPCLPFCSFLLLNPCVPCYLSFLAFHVSHPLGWSVYCSMCRCFASCLYFYDSVFAICCSLFFIGHASFSVFTQLVGLTALVHFFLYLLLLISRALPRSCFSFIYLSGLSLYSLPHYVQSGVSTTSATPGPTSLRA